MVIFARETSYASASANAQRVNQEEPLKLLTLISTKTIGDDFLLRFHASPVPLGRLVQTILQDTRAY